MNTPSDDIMCYAVKYPPHPGYGTIIVDNPKYAKETAKEIAKAIRQGGLPVAMPKLLSPVPDRLRLLDSFPQTEVANSTQSHPSFLQCPVLDSTGHVQPHLLLYPTSRLLAENTH